MALRMRRRFDLADELINFLADGGVLGGVRGEKFECAAPVNQGVGERPGGGRAFGFGGNFLEFVAVDESVAGRAKKKARRQFRATLCAGHRRLVELLRFEASVLGAEHCWC